MSLPQIPFLSIKLSRFSPSVLGLILQISSFSVCVVIKLLCITLIDYKPSTFAFCLLQGLLAAAVAKILGTASWWRYIHLLFPLSVWLMLSINIPSYVYLTGFIVSSSLYWSTFKTQVPFYPSGPSAWMAVAKFIPDEKTMQIIDIGSGIGDLSMKLAQLKPRSVVSGIEIAPLPWFISVIRSKLKGSRAQFILGNYQDLNFAQFDIIFAYLSPAAMTALWEKSSQEMANGSLLICHEFLIPNIKPSTILNASHNRAATYIYQIRR